MSQNNQNKELYEIIAQKLSQYGRETGYLRIYDDDGNEGRFVYLGLMKNGSDAFAVFRMIDEENEKSGQMKVTVMQVSLNSEGELDVYPVDNPEKLAALHKIAAQIIRQESNQNGKQ